MNRKILITIGEGIFSIGFISLLVFLSRTETPELKSVSSEAVKQSSEPLNKFASLKNEYQTKENKMWAAINKCSILRQNEISYEDTWTQGPSFGLTVRSNNFSVYDFYQYKDERNLTIGSSCREKGKFEFNKVYLKGSRQIEFFKLFDQCDKYGRCNPIEIHAYTKEENSSVERTWVFKVSSDGKLRYRSYSEIF